MAEEVGQVTAEEEAAFVPDIIEPELAEGVDTEESPADTGEAAPAEAAPPAEEAAPEVAAEAEQPRDESGKFVKREAAAEEAPAEEAAPPEEAPPTEAPEYPEFSYRYAGREYNLPGSKYGQEGVFIPTDSLPEFQRLLGRAEVGQKQIADLQRQVTAAGSEGKGELERAQAILGKLADLRNQGPDAVAAWLDELDKNWDLMEARAETEQLRAQSERLTAREKELDDERAADELVPKMEQELQAAVLETAQRYPGVDASAMYQRLSRSFIDQIFYDADEDDPGGGFKRGEMVMDVNVIENEFKYHQQLTGQGSKATANALAHNKAATAESTAPPAVPAGGATPPTTTKPLPTFKNKEEADEFIRSGAWRQHV